MPHILKNDNLTIRIDFPKENYRHSRFDWTGKIVEVKYKGMLFSGSETMEQKVDNLYGKGFYNEFGIDSPLGYNEAKVGEWFHKIGVGLLKKEDEKYDFLKLYEIKPADFEVKCDTQRIFIKCQSQSNNGYSYLLKKEICLLKSGFRIKYYLKNTGTKSISTNEYNHNFLSIDDQLINEDYILEFPFILKSEQFGETINEEKKVEIGKKNVKFKDSPNKPFFFSNISGGANVEPKWKLENTRRKIAISEKGDFSTNSINLWGWGHVICPELFISIHIEAGQSITWSRKYEIYDSN